MEDLAQTVLEHVQTAALAVDERGRLRVCNPAAERVLAVPATELLERSLDELRAMGEPLSAVAVALEEARRDGESRARCQMTLRTDGGVRTIGYSLSMLKRTGEVAMLFADLTETLVKEQREAEERRFAEVGRIASAMAHELKSPLATIRLYSELLLRGLQSGEGAASSSDPAGDPAGGVAGGVARGPAAGRPSSVRDQAEVIRDQVRRCQERLTAILRSISPQTGQAALFGLAELEPVVRSVVRDQRRRFPGAVIAVRASVGDAKVGLSESDLASLVGNLVGNALEVSGGKGPVAVSLSRSDGHVVVRVADRGRGLPEGDLFAPFFSTKAGGTGLGLWLVRRLVTAAGGAVEAANRRGGGAAFRVVLPVADRAALRGARVLLLEDDRALCGALGTALEACGAEVRASASVAEAAEENARGGHCLAVLDFHLPDGDATDLARVLSPDLPVLLMSGDGQAAGVAGRLPQRRVRFVPKPFDLDAFLDLASLLVVTP